MVVNTDITQWSLTKTTANSAQTPADIIPLQQWLAVPVPGTVAQAVGDARPQEDLEQYDWWYTAQFPMPKTGKRTYLQCDGLATLSEVWVNDQQVLYSQSMFENHKLDITDYLQTDNTLAIVFKALAPHLAERRARPQWKTNLVDNQNLRWFRTSLLGRMPGWTPHIKAIGPWRDISIVSVAKFDLVECTVFSEVDEALNGKVHVNLELDFIDAKLAADPQIQFLLDGKIYPITAKPIKGGGAFIDTEIAIEQPQLWWPHTHGEPYLHAYKITAIIDGEVTTLTEGKLGFKRVTAANQTNQLALELNNNKIFCRGACWATPNITSLNASKQEYRHLLKLLVDAGANMVRVGGTMVYEHNDFYALCDELGILVWQDFMFANMDYPFADEDFSKLVAKEVRQQITRLKQTASIAAFCGNSEMQQQAAMMGMEQSQWANALFDTFIPQKLEEQQLMLPYFTSSPCEGGLPFHTDTGLTHYYGVGAYKLMPDHFTVREVGFTSECLGFSHIPVTASLKQAFESPYPATHTPNWKAGIPRDNSAGWDFEDIRNFYLEKIFGVVADTLRYSEPETYFKLATIATAEMVSSVYSIWRASVSNCNGALAWFYQDIVAGAGWGMVDSFARPKAAYYFLKRVWQPQQVLLINNSLNGYTLEVQNETAHTLQAQLYIVLVGLSDNIVAEHTQEITLAANSVDAHKLDTVFGRFMDATHAYKFGRQTIYAVVAELRNESGELISQAVSFPGCRRINTGAGEITGSITSNSDNESTVTLTPSVFVEYACLESKATQFSDNYTCMLPGKTYSFKACEQIKSVQVSTLNLQKEFRVT